MNISTEAESSDRQPGRPAKRRSILTGMLAGGLFGTMLAGAATAFADGDKPHAFWHAGHGCGHHNAMHDPETMRERADFAADWVLDRIKATDEQRPRVKAVVQTALDNLLKVQREHQQNRAAMVEALSQATVDRAQLQHIRQSEVRLMDDASTGIVNALADVAEILTPEQRRQLAEMASRWRGRGSSL